MAVGSTQLSIVIPSHNRPDLLRLCLDSVQRHAPGGTQVIVVDDGSKDAIVSETASEFAGIEIIRHQRPLGFAIAANRGIAAATGTFVELLNDDTQVTVGWAETALRQFDDASVAAVAPLVLRGPCGGRPRIDSAGDEYDRGGFAHKRGHGEPLSDRFLYACDVFGASASTAFYRASVLRAVGCFPEDFGAYFEDVDLSWRIHRAGHRTRFEPASIVWHRVGASHRKRRALLEQQSRNEERVFWRNVSSLRAALPRHALVLVAKAMRRLREGTLGPWLAGRFRAFRELPGLMGGRDG